jgi:protease-4
MHDDIRYKACAAQYFGMWFVESQWIQQAVAAFNTGVMEAVKPTQTEGASRPYILQDGLAQLSINGYMAKGTTSFGGTSTVQLRQLLRMAKDDPAVEAALLYIDSPGGTVAGCAELADDITAFADVKPIHVHIQDLGASAAYYAAAGATRITANASAMIGSLGTIVSLVDRSEMLAKDGIKVHLITTAPMKAVGDMDVEQTDEMIAYVQELVDFSGQQFIDHVNASRDISLEMGKGAADGRVFLAEKALTLGLIDAVQSLDKTFADIRAQIDESRQQTQAGSNTRFMRTRAVTKRSIAKIG